MEVQPVHTVSGLIYFPSCFIGTISVCIRDAYPLYNTWQRIGREVLRFFYRASEWQVLEYKQAYFQFIIQHLSDPVLGLTSVYLLSLCCCDTYYLVLSWH
jgi:hypothetical protein